MQDSRASNDADDSGGARTEVRPVELPTTVLPRQRGPQATKAARATVAEGRETPSHGAPDNAGQLTDLAGVDDSAATLTATLAPDPVSAAATAVGTLTGSGSFSGWLRVWGLHLEVGAAFLAGVTVAFAIDPNPYTALVVLSVWLLGAYHSGRAVTTPLTRQFGSLLMSASLPLTVVAAGVAFAGLAPVHLSRTFTTLGAAGLMSVICRMVRWTWQAPVRVVVVGDRAAVASSTTRWARDSSVRVVGALVMEEGLDPAAVPQDILGVPAAAEVESARALVREVRADLVLVTPGPGMTAEMFSRMAWALEDSRAAIGVSGVLSSVAPHRVTAGKLENAGVINVRPPRPSTVVRGIKAATDRVLGAVLLVLAAPLLLAMALAIRIDSRGPALFKQTRIGRGGKPFTLYKMRTMIQEADAIKSALGEENEFDSVLFKVRKDPRITRIGGLLRKSSLDELPQLLNVIKGEMSLVGPRPNLPQEVADMDADQLRRHAVQPGMTGLWQVSGRSDLSWNESWTLDTYYADNWSLGGDALIALRTIKAVSGGKGAY